jgi:hypothetical protein
MTTYTLIDQDTNDISMFVFDNELNYPVYVNHLKGLGLGLGFSLDLEYTAFVNLAQFIANYINNFDKIHPSLIIPD